MGIWIRSQNGKDLLEVNKVYIKTDNSLWSASVCLGEYSSDERACEVLEEIQEQIEAKSVYKMPRK